jgi:hypothetical protein
MVAPHPLSGIPSPLGGIASPFGGGGRGLPLELRPIQAMYPGFLSGARYDCRVPPQPEWHETVAALEGSLYICDRPLPGVIPDDGFFAVYDCSRSIA